MAQAETPKPWNFCSLSRPSHLAWAPVEMITVSASQSWPLSVFSRNGRCDRSALSTMSLTISVPTCSAWACICSISQGPWMTSAKPG